MKTKEEAIKEAWGKNYPPSGTDKNGWLNERHLTNSQCCELNKNESIEYNNALGYRPKSLQGIENNNGWIRIESEDDLPSKGDYMHFIIKYFEEIDNKGVFDGNYFWHDKECYPVEVVTHYQPIFKPKKPIY